MPNVGGFIFIVVVFLQVGDGTTTVVLLAGEFLKEAKPFIEDGVHPRNLIRSYRTASNLVCILNLIVSFSCEDRENYCANA